MQNVTRSRRFVLGAPVVIAIAATAVGFGLTSGGAGATATSTVAACGTGTPRLTVQGTGQSSATPDVLTAVVPINTTGPSATAALSEDNARVDAAVFALTGNGVAKKDIATTDLTITAQYAFPKTGPVITGYQVSNTLTATLRHTDQAGAALDALVGAVGNSTQISSLTFSFSNPAAVESRARTLAVQQAVRHARAMAAAAGRRLGPVCSLTDDSTPPLPQNQTIFGSALGAATIPSQASSAVPLEAGSQNESDQVTLVYAVVSR
jgi:hypothetical protein